MKVLKDLAVSGQITVGQLLQSSIDTDKFIVSDGGVAKFRTGSQLLGDIDGVINTRTITINGTAQDLTANRSWTVGDVRSDSSYANPAWITSLAWSKITGAPAFLTAEADTLATVTGRGATTTSSITAGGFVKSGGTSSQFLKADGSVDSNTYLTSVSDVWVNTSGDTMTGQLRIDLQNTINTTTPGTGTGYGLHFGGQSTADSATGITFSAGGAAAANANAGIYVQGSGSYGTKMYIATTDSYATGAKTAISIDHMGLVNFVRVRPQFGGSNLALASEIPTNLNQLTNGPGYITSYTETDTLATVTGRGATTSTTLTLARVVTTGLYGPGTSGVIIPIWQYNSGNPGYGVAYEESSPDKFRIDVSGSLMSGTPDFEVIPDAVRINGNTAWHAGNLTNLNQLTNGPGYITSYTETDTLATVTGRGASTSTNVTFSGNITNTGTLFMKDSGPSIYENRINAGWNSTGDAIDLWINYEGYQNSTAHFRDFRVGNGKRGGAILFIDGSEGTAAFSGAVTIGGNTVWHAGNLTNLNQLSNGPGYITSSALNSYLPLSGGTMSGFIQLSGNQLRFDNSGVRSWNIGVSGGNLSVNSGDGSGSLLYNGRPLRDSYYRTYSGHSDYYGGGTAGWYRVAQITLTGNCSGSVLYGTLYDNRYDGADSYQIAVVARAECDFTSNNESHYINVGCTILGSTNYTDYRSKIRVVLTGSSSGSRTYELQFYESPWNHDTWQIETTGWTVYTSPQVANASTGTPRVNYISNKNADYIRANTAVYSPVYYDSSNTQYYLDGNVSGGWRVGTPTGYLDFGPLNADFCHFQTDRTKFYFNKRVEIDGELHRYGGSRFVENTGTWSISVTGSAGSLSSMNISQFNNNSGYITSTNTDFTYAATLTITTSWQNSGVSNSNLTSNGVYLVTVYANDAAVAGYQYSETHVGLMYWYASNTNGENYAEIPLHHMGHADNDRYFYLRTKTTTGGNGSFLQIRGNYTANGNSTYTFTFKRLM